MTEAMIIGSLNKMVEGDSSYTAMILIEMRKLVEAKNKEIEILRQNALRAQERVIL